MLFACYKSSEFPPGIIFLEPGECFFTFPAVCVCCQWILLVLSHPKMSLFCLYFFFPENKFYLNKGLNTLHNIKTEEEGKKQKTSLFHKALGSCC